MCSNIPRRLIDEMITRWELTGERVLMVEGTDDQRFVLLLQAEGHCESAFATLAVLPADAVEISGEIVRRHGLHGTGAKQRVIAFFREIEHAAASDGFRGVVDQDVDRFVSLDYSSIALWYTDHGCMDVYLWSPETLRRLLIQFQCEARIVSAAALLALYSTIGTVCAALAAVRVAALLHPEWALAIHRSTNALRIHNETARLDIARYVRQANPPRGLAGIVVAEVDLVYAELDKYDPLDLMNGHDLLWVVVFVLRELSTLPRRVIDEAAVAGALLSFGVMDPALPTRPLFARLAEWAAA